MCVVLILEKSVSWYVWPSYRSLKVLKLISYGVFRSDPKLFTDDTDIKYCKALNCCKLPKVSAEINSVP